jgi:hypothetical protein
MDFESLSLDEQLKITLEAAKAAQHDPEKAYLEPGLSQLIYGIERLLKKLELDKSTTC